MGAGGYSGPLAASDILRQNLTGHELTVNGHDATPLDRKHLVKTPTKPHGYSLSGGFCRLFLMPQGNVFCSDQDNWLNVVEP